MTFNSILFRNAEDRSETDAIEPPSFFSDLNLDQIIQGITAGREGYDLRPFYFTPLRDAETIRYRQEVMGDLESPNLMGYINGFCGRMTIVRRYLDLVDTLYSDYHKKGWFLEAALVYGGAVEELALNLAQAEVSSRGLMAFRKYVAAYVRSQEFRSFVAEARQVKYDLSQVQYCVIIRGGRLSVRRYEGETDYAPEVEKTFERFKQGAVKDYLAKLNEPSGMNHIEAKILEFMARLFPEQFAALDLFCERQSGFVDVTIKSFDREIQFYVAYLEFIADIKRKGLSFSYPEVDTGGRQEYVKDAFDLALARKLRSTDKTVVCNDFFLGESERIIVVSGPNQGGKTTFARMFGQLHYLASLGCPVPGRRVRLSLFDKMFTHFEREEDIHDLRGKLQDDMVRIHDILTGATASSILIVNEIFASTTLNDAVFLSKAIMAKLIDLDILCVWVTFIDELSLMSEKTVSMISTVMAEDPAVRTFKILRRPADGLAYALSIAKKYRLTYEQVRERIES